MGLSKEEGRRFGKALYKATVDLANAHPEWYFTKAELAEMTYKEGAVQKMAHTNGLCDHLVRDCSERYGECIDCSVYPICRILYDEGYRNQNDLKQSILAKTEFYYKNFTKSALESGENFTISQLSDKLLSILEKVLEECVD